MVPTIATRLRTLMKSLQEVLLPALDPANAIAQEQGQLVLGSLNLILAQLDFAHAFEVVEAREMSAHALELATLLEADAAAHGLVTGVRHQVSAQQSAIDNPLTPLHALQVRNRALREVLSALITAAQACADANLTRTLERRVLEFGARQLTRERSWVAATNFEPPGTTPPIPVLLGIPPTP